MTTIDAPARVLDADTIRCLALRFTDTSREALIEDGLLAPHTPARGTSLLGPEHRTFAGERLLAYAKDTLHALLFGDAASGTMLCRTQRELLTMVLPRTKAHALGFLRATTEIAAAGTWRDPQNVSNDERADNVLLEVEYGEVDDELVGDGIVCCLRLINALEVNEQVLYARMIDVEQSTLIS